MTVAEALKQSKAITFMLNGSIKAAQNMLLPGEEIRWATCCTVYKRAVHGELNLQVNVLSGDSLNGVLVLTDQRIFFVNNTLTLHFSKEVRLRSIRSVDTSANYTIASVRIVGESDMIVAWGQRKPMECLRNAVNEALAKRDAANEQPPRQDSQDDQLQASDIEQLQALKQLYDSGVLTEEEFSAKKAQILNL